MVEVTLSQKDVLDRFAILEDAYHTFKKDHHGTVPLVYSLVSDPKPFTEKHGFVARIFFQIISQIKSFLWSEQVTVKLLDKEVNIIKGDLKSNILLLHRMVEVVLQADESKAVEPKTFKQAVDLAIEIEHDHENELQEAKEETCAGLLWEHFVGKTKEINTLRGVKRLITDEESEEIVRNCHSFMKDQQLRSQDNLLKEHQVALNKIDQGVEKGLSHLGRNPSLDQVRPVIKDLLDKLREEKKRFDSSVKRFPSGLKKIYTDLFQAFETRIYLKTVLFSPELILSPFRDLKALKSDKEGLQGIANYLQSVREEVQLLLQDPDESLQERARYFSDEVEEVEKEIRFAMGRLKGPRKEIKIVSITTDKLLGRLHEGFSKEVQEMPVETKVEVRKIVEKTNNVALKVLKYTPFILSSIVAGALAWWNKDLGVAGVAALGFFGFVGTYVAETKLATHIQHSAKEAVEDFCPSASPLVKQGVEVAVGVGAQVGVAVGCFYTGNLAAHVVKDYLYNPVASMVNGVYNWVFGIVNIPKPSDAHYAINGYLLKLFAFKDQINNLTTIPSAVKNEGLNLINQLAGIQAKMLPSQADNIFINYARQATDLCRVISQRLG